MSEISWQGVYPAVATAFHDDERLDVAATLRHLDALVEAGVHGLIMLGTVGENGSLDADEKRELLAAAVGHVGGRLPVLAGVAENTTRAACRFAAEAEQVGADALMVLPAMIYPSDPRETMAHFRAVASASGLPVLLYNNPLAYHVDVTVEMLAELAEEPTIAAVKESSEDVRRITDLRNLLGDRLHLLCGVDDLALESFLLGAEGWVSGMANAFPEEACLLWQLARDRRWREAGELYRWFSPLLHLDAHVKLVQYIKLAMYETGLGTEHLRRPRLPISGRERDRVLAVIREGIALRPQDITPQEGAV